MDYRSFSPSGPQSSPVDGIAKQWWKERGENASQAIAGIIRLLTDHQGMRLTQQAISARLYGNLMPFGLNGISISRLANVAPAVRDRVSYNVVASVIDTITAKIGKNKPRPLFLTSGGDYKLQRKAKKLTKFCDGVFYENKAYRLGVEAFRDGAVFGTGAVHVYPSHGRVRMERVLTSELFVDELEALYGEPRQLHRVKSCDRDVLADAFPDHRALVKQTNPAMLLDGGTAPAISDMVTVRESWHLPSGPEAKDGRHVISVDGGTLLEERWDRPFFPFAFFHWSKRLYGFWGQGAAERLQNLQLEINKNLYVIQRAYQLAGAFKVLVENGSKIVKEHLNNDIGAIVNYTGTPPQYVVPPGVPPEIYSHLVYLVQLAFEQEGVSQLSAGSQKPAGLNSGKALREYNDIESDRFTTIGHAYENFYLDLAKIAIATVKGIVEEEGGDYEVSVPDRTRAIQVLRWEDVDLRDEEYVMQCFPTSSLPNEPHARLATVQEYAQAGYITPRQAKRLLQFPDLEQVENLENATEEWLNQVFEKMVEDGEYTPPEPYDDLALAREMALEFYTLGKTQNLEEERLELLRRYLGQIDELEQASMEAQAAAAAGPADIMGAPPQAVPEPPPTSDLIPNVPGTPVIQ